MEAFEKENDKTVESILRNFYQKQKAEYLIKNILNHIKYQSKPVLTEEMKARSHTGGRAELEGENARHREALKVPNELREGMIKELRRTLIRLEWGWGFGFFPEEKYVDYLASKDYRYVIFGMYQINKGFIMADCPTPPSEDDIFRSIE